MKPLKKFTRKFPLLIALLMLVYCWCTVKYIPQVTEGMWGLAINEFLYAVGCVILTLLLAGTGIFVFSSKGIKFAFKKSLYYLIIVVILGLMTFLLLFSNGANMGEIIPCLIVLCIAVGVFEELVFRVFIFGGLVAKFGKKRAGIMWAAIISSLLFGFIHVAGTLFSGENLTFVVVAQIILKTIQTGIFGYLLCAIYLKTRNFWVIAGMHAFNDFMVLGYSLSTTGGGPNYTGGDMTAVIFITVFTLLCIPVIVTATKILFSCKTPQQGPLLDDKFLPCSPVVEKKSKKKKN